MDSFYYYGENGQRSGPVNARQLRTLAKTGQIRHETIIETEEGKKCPARKVQGLTFGTEPLTKESEPSSGGTAKIVLPPDEKKSGDTVPHTAPKTGEIPQSAQSALKKSPADLSLDELRQRRLRRVESASETSDVENEEPAAMGFFGPRPLEGVERLLELFAGITVILMILVPPALLLLWLLHKISLVTALAVSAGSIFYLLILRIILLFFAGAGRSLRSLAESNAELLEVIRKS